MATLPASGQPRRSTRRSTRFDYAEPSPESEDEEHLAECVLQEERREDGVLWYEVKWAGTDPKTGLRHEPSWIPADGANKALKKDWERLKRLRRARDAPAARTARQAGAPRQAQAERSAGAARQAEAERLAEATHQAKAERTAEAGHIVEGVRVDEAAREAPDGRVPHTATAPSAGGAAPSAATLEASDDDEFTLAREYQPITPRREERAMRLLHQPYESLRRTRQPSCDRPLPSTEQPYTLSARQTTAPIFTPTPRSAVYRYQPYPSSRPPSSPPIRRPESLHRLMAEVMAESARNAANTELDRQCFICFDSVETFEADGIHYQTLRCCGKLSCHNCLRSWLERADKPDVCAHCRQPLEEFELQPTTREPSAMSETPSPTHTRRLRPLTRP